MSQRYEDQVVRQKQLHEHDVWEFAHAEMRDKHLSPLIDRISKLENWRWWVIGIGAVLIFEIPIAVLFLK